MHFYKYGSQFSLDAVRNILWAAVFVLLLCLPAQADKQPLRIDYPNFWPFFTRTEEGRMQGFFYETIHEALRRMEITAVWEAYPWARCQEHVKQGEADAMITVPTPERLEYTVTHATPFYFKKLTVFTYVGHPQAEEIQSIKTIDDIKKLDLTVITYSGNGWNDRNIRSRKIRTYETPKLESVWAMLANRRGDIVIEWPVAAWPDIKASNVAHEIVMTDATLESMPFHLMVRKDSPFAGCLPQFDDVIRTMQQDGTINDIMSKYIREFQRKLQ